MEMNKMLSYREAAAVLQVSERKVWELVKQGLIRASKIGRQVRITMEALQDYIKSTEMA